ncbi:compound eye opsin BCRH2 [Daphnia magna]|uniref:Class a rhodopsin g-protein coupled receptor gprop1 n=2 Tax=Daphnia magna TaxID=35525 RepID=A0A0P6EKX8_9CRUS|nr:compound eye opsin BCRH2 [Daphnia magna]KAK4035835.1 hypothetical protein OUZ56_027917 [Daphnia magna]KZS05019.1 Long-wavelength-like opsin [Daphnia magna]
MANLTGDAVVAMAQKQAFDPWALPDSFTLYAYAPEDIRSFLHPHWHTYKALHPAWYYFLGLMYLVIGTCAVAGNAVVLKIFSRFPALRSPANLLVMNLAVSDFLLMLALFPECVYNFFLGGPWRFGEMGCQIHAFLGACFGYNQIFTLTMISYDRYNVIVKGFSGTPLTFNRAVTIITMSWIWALGWSICPLVGWGAYAMDGIMGTCSYDYVSQNMNNKSHILAATFANYILPIIIIAGCYYFIVHAVFKHEEELRAQAKKMNVASLRSNNDQQQVSAEIRIAKVSIMNVSMWLTAWTPFAVICILGTWGDVSKITPLVSAIPVILAKTSCAYNPLIYAISHPKYRECLKQMFPWMCIVEEKKAAADNQSVISDKTEMTEIVKCESA